MCGSIGGYLRQGCNSLMKSCRNLLNILLQISLLETSLLTVTSFADFFEFGTELNFIRTNFILQVSKNRVEIVQSYFLAIGFLVLSDLSIFDCFCCFVYFDKTICHLASLF